MFNPEQPTHDVVYVDQQGAPDMDHWYLRYANDDVIIVDIDMRTKYCEITAVGNGMLMVGCKDCALYLHRMFEDDPKALTILRLAEPYAHWEYAASSCARYTITAVFHRRYESE